MGRANICQRCKCEAESIEHLLVFYSFGRVARRVSFSSLGLIFIWEDGTFQGIMER